MNILKTNLFGTCPGGFCEYIQTYSEVLVVILCLDGFIFFVTLLPPLFSWSNKKPDGRKRVYFAALACFTFYFWLAFLALNSLYCFGFMAHQGPCKSMPDLILPKLNKTSFTSTATSMPAFPTLPEATSSSLPTVMASISASEAEPTKLSSTLLNTLKPKTTSTQIQTRPTTQNLTSTTSTTLSSTSSSSSTVQEQDLQKNAGVPMALISWTSSKANSSCVQLANEHETQLKNLTLVNILILIVLFIVFIANAREVMTAKALYHKETLCKREEVQRFLSSLVLKPPEVGHLINCFHMAKTNSDARNKKANVAATAANLTKKDAKDAGPPRKVVTFSAIENFTYQTWRDFSDLRLIEPSSTYPIIEIEVMLNFFPGDHYTAERYKAFVNQMTKTHSGKDARITIDDYFHVEDHREWTFFIGNENYIAPWWDSDAAKIPLGCIFLLGWPFRMAYGGRIAKHQVEIKKAVFVENNTADEGVSLSATPASEAGEAKEAVTVSSEKKEEKPVVLDSTEAIQEENESEAEEHEDETRAMLEAKPPVVTSTASSIDQFTEHRVNAVVSHPPKESQNYSDHQYFYQQMQVGPSIPTTRNKQIPAFGHPLANVLPQQQPQLQQQRRLRTLCEKDNVASVTAVTHQDINGVSTVAMKDLDSVQMTAMSGYETYV